MSQTRLMPAHFVDAAGRRPRCRTWESAPSSKYRHTLITPQAATSPFLLWLEPGPIPEYYFYRGSRHLSHLPSEIKTCLDNIANGHEVIVGDAWRD